MSELCKQLDPEVQEWNNRSLHGQHYPFVAIDAFYIKVREDGRVRSRGILVGYGVGEDGKREILGLQSPTPNPREAGASIFAG